MKKFILLISIFCNLATLELQTGYKGITDQKFLTPKTTKKYENITPDQLAAELISLLNQTVQLYATINLNDFTTHTEQQKNLWQQAITFIEALRSKKINSAPVRSDINTLKNISLQENKTREMITFLIDEYIAHFGQMYEKRSTIVYGHSKYFVLASQSDKDQPITPFVYQNLLQTLQLAAKQTDLARTIIITLPVILENNFVIKKQFTLQEIIKAIEQLAPSSDFYNTAKNIAIGAAAIGATAAIGYGIYKNYNPAQNAMLPISTPNKTEPAQITIDPENITNATNNTPMKELLHIEEKNKKVESANIVEKDKQITENTNQPLSHLENSAAQDEFFATLQPRSLIDIAADNVRSYDAQQEALKNKKLNETIKELAQHGNQDALEIIDAVNNKLELNTQQINFIDQIEQSIPNRGNFDIFDTAQHHDPIFKNDTIPFPITKKESPLTAYPKVAGNIAVIGSKAIANEIPSMTMHAINNLANLPNDIAHRAQVGLVNYYDAKNNTNNLDRTKYAQYTPGKGAIQQIEKINRISDSESASQNENATIMSQDKRYTITSDVVAANPFDLENSYIQADAADMNLAMTAASMLDATLIKSLGNAAGKTLSKPFAKNLSEISRNSFNPKTMYSSQ
ncbi:MAG: hypothetical protein ACXWL2_02610 [Candidatus Chromulinivorax sp.]